LDWDHLPDKNYSVPPEHPYARDLDIIGEHSLLQLLDTTVSTRGTKFLLDWLLYPKADLKELNRRQQLVQELKGYSLFRDKLTLEALCLSDEEIDGVKILTHLQYSLPSWLLCFLKVEVILWLITLLFFMGLFLYSFPPYFGFIPYVGYSLVFLFSLPYLTPIFNRTSSLELEFKKLKAVFLHLERRTSTKTPELANCCAHFRNTNVKPSSYIKKVSHVCDALSIQANSLVHLGVNLLFPWDFFFVWRWEILRRQILKKLPLWLDSLGKIEAASALANFANNNPSYTLPYLEIIQEKSNIGIQIENLGHPAIPHEKRKTNNFTLKGLGTLAIITGSNMSGKSTFLKTLGINLCLARAGGFVCATYFRSSWFQIFGCLRVNDSVTEGLSYFYAEVKRLKIILDASNDWSGPPVLVLIDEIFKGTNNRERIIGSTCYLLRLIERNVLALISTHDLEVTKISNQEKDKIINYHFQEKIENGHMEFDYRLRNGVCPTTNALKILQLEGLPVPNS